MECRRGALVACLGVWLPAVAAPAAEVPVPCPADVNGDGAIGFPDLLAITSQWNLPCAGCSTDLNGDGVVGFADLVILLAAPWGPCPSGTISSLEMAGNALDQYPYVEFVRAFNAGAGAEIAIDPVILPPGGIEADVYIVAARSEAEWERDQDLVDVRGGPQPIVFNGSSIADNTSMLAGSAALDADAGTGLGVGYDLVCDVDRDGLLGDGDLIDGFDDEAGFYVVGDLTQPGPLEVTTIDYVVEEGTVTPGFLNERTSFPTAIEGLGMLPLVVVSHGQNQSYQWYDYLATHLASYGYVVMSHKNNTVPGPESAAISTYEHSVAFLDQLDTIGEGPLEGVLEGHVDATRIAWVGHSRGGEGVVRAYTRLREGSFPVIHFSSDDVLLVSSIAPLAFMGPGVSEPGPSNYHLIWGSADMDIAGNSAATNWAFSLFERATGFRQSTYVHGASHEAFNCCGPLHYDGPPETFLDREETQRVAKAVYLALVKHYLDGNVPAKDFLWRQSERLRPLGVAPTTVVVSDYRDAAGAPGFVIDDFQTEPSTGVSSSGGAVTFDVQNVVEAILQDSTLTVPTDYCWTPGDPMNGMSRAVTGDTARGLVFDWNLGPDRFLEFEIVPALHDFTPHAYLSFRACQQTRHPETVAELGDLTFTVALRDTSRNVSRIDIGAYGGGIEEVYQRCIPCAGDGAVGWQNEFEVIRIWLTDFLHDNDQLDLSNVEAIRFEFGSTAGSSRGRIGFDDLIVSGDAPPPSRPVTITLPGGAPSIIPADTSVTVDVIVNAGAQELVPGRALLHYRIPPSGLFAQVRLDPAGINLYQTQLPARPCGSTIEYYFSAEGVQTGQATLPSGAPAAAVFAARFGTLVTQFLDTFESDLGWTVQNSAGLQSGAWERGVPAGDGTRGDPTEDSGDAGSQCFLTWNVAGNSDVDGGTTTLVSPVLDASHPEATIEYARWYSNASGSAPFADTFVVEASDDGGATWHLVEAVGPDGPEVDGGWFTRAFRVQDVPGLTSTAQFRIRFSASDLAEPSVVEAAIDAVHLFVVECP
jgi:hypothetical protein